MVQGSGMSPLPPSWYRALSAAGCGRGDSSAGGSRARGRSETPLSHIQAADLAVDFRLENIFDSDEGMARLLGAGLIHIDVNHEGDVEDAVLQYLDGVSLFGCRV